MESRKLEARVGKPTIDQILNSLTNEVLPGRAYLTMADGLKDADPVVLKCSPTFFGLSIEACLQMSQIYVAKLYDKTKGAITAKSLLDRAKLEAPTFKHGTAHQVSLAVKDSQNRIDGLQGILKSVQTRRNEAIAHLDPRTVIDPVGLASRAKLTIADLEKIFDETSIILNKVLCLWKDTYASLEFIGGDDYETALELIADAKHAQVDRWEREFPNTTCDFPRPNTPRRAY
jgi:HEPN superfamily AbiU2-like protein